MNIAFEDAMILADAIIDAGKDGKKEALDARIKAFEEKMFVRADKAERLSDGIMGDLLFTAGAPLAGSWVLKRIAYELHPLLYPIVYPLVAALVYGVLFWKNLWR